MHYRIVPTDPERYEVEQGRWRVTTLAYLYEFRTRTTRSCGRCIGTRPAGATPASPISTSTPSAPTGTSSPATDPRVSGAVVHRDGSGAAEPAVAHGASRVRGHPPAVPIPGPKNRHHLVVDAGPHALQQGSWSAEGSPGFPITSSPPTAPAGGRVGRRPIPQGSEAPPAAGAVGQGSAGVGAGGVVGKSVGGDCCGGRRHGRGPRGPSADASSPKEACVSIARHFRRSRTTRTARITAGPHATVDRRDLTLVLAAIAHAAGHHEYHHTACDPDGLANPSDRLPPLTPAPQPHLQ